ncbi:MarR family transcriptional regulator [Gemella sp. GH3]|uniref:MarR family winged helix-turn-helix transcriptional regulator n=1 Tax=unclassified Gemella TaxID=2624949 RepID=UPI0015CFFC98|nr:MULTISPECIES: MarR family transcriptional regulator [unclassified Gemella]MBF0713560.1 MarR family transcriptional regulator [Gemella sp. GH3.1]NYS50512.1 MarR family transcriptional regulator [Gemella sp. GH3]
MKAKDISKLIYKIKIVEQKFKRNFEAKFGVSLTRYEILQVISEKNELAQGELQEYLQIDQAAITRHLKILEEKNYVKRIRNPKNNREIFVSLTDKAKTEMKEYDKNCPKMEEFFGNKFTKDDAEYLLMLLEKFEKNIE